MILTKKIWWSAIVLLLAVGITTMGHAQFSANVQGMVSDPAGAVVPHANVTLHNVDTGIDIHGATNHSGFYRFSSVAPGNYNVVVNSGGFGAASVAVSVTTAETRGVDVTLQVSKGANRVEVHSVASALNPDETRIQTTLTASEISKLPLPNRDVQLLGALTPGVVGFINEAANGGYDGNTGGVSAGIFQPNTVPPFSANGLGTNANLFEIDDLPVMSANTQGSALIVPNADMIQEVALQTQTYSLENGTSASIQTAYTTKSGTNAFHGDADYTYASPNVGAAKQPLAQINAFHRNLFLGSLGGPIYKNHTFFFGSIEKLNSATSGSGLNGLLYSPQFAAYAVQTFPGSRPAAALKYAYSEGTRNSGGTPVLASAVYPTTCGTTQTSNGYTYVLPCDTVVYTNGSFTNQAQPFNGLQWNVRLDQNFRGGADRVYGQYQRVDQKLGYLSDLPALDAVTPSQNKYFAVNYTHIFSPHLLNEAHFGNLRAFYPSTFVNVLAAGVPFGPSYGDVDYGGQFVQPFGSVPYAGTTTKEHTYAFRDTVFYTAGNHALSGGYQWYRGDVYEDNTIFLARPENFYEGNDAIGFATGAQPAYGGWGLYTIGGNGKFQPQIYGATGMYNGIFAQDSWKVTPNLTVDYGIRYDNFGNPTQYGAGTLPFVPVFPGAGSTFQQQALLSTTKIATRAFASSMQPNFQPRAGFAWTPLHDNKKTLFRGGVGLYENALTPFEVTVNLPTQVPNRLALTESGPLPFGDFSTASAPYGYNYPATPTYGFAPSGNAYSNPQQTTLYASSLNAYARDIKPEKAVNYSFGMEQQLPANAVFGLTYAGSHGFDLDYNGDWNQVEGSTTRPSPYGWGAIEYTRNGLRSNYNGLIVTLRQNYKSLSYQASYTWSHSRQTAPPVAGFNLWPEVYDANAFYGPNGNDIPKAFSFGGSYEVPKFSTGNKLVNLAAAGWQVGALIIAQSGTPFSVYNNTTVGDGTSVVTSGSYQLDGNPDGHEPSLPQYTGTRRSGFSRSELLNGAFTTSQFVVPAGYGVVPLSPNQQGVNTFRNPGYFNVDASLSKGFFLHVPRLGTATQFILRGEAVNLLNHTNFEAIDNVLGDSNFGKVTAANQARYLQIGGRFEF